MARKGRLGEVFSRALYSDNPNLYTVGYRDFQTIAQVSLLDFITISGNFEIIPASRIVFVKRQDRILYQKFKKI
jgi:hypothetical protein